MNSSLNVLHAMGKIESLFIEQCKHGAQAKKIAANQSACGQFLDSHTNDHKGLHGTAAALQVLAQSSIPEATALVSKLVHHISDRRQTAPDDKSQKNVIKLGELLYALAYVKAGQCPTDSVVADIAKILLESSKNDQGWTYFIDSTLAPDPLPTAFAILGLCKHGYENKLSGPIKYLTDRVLKGPKGSTDMIHETSVRIFCVFALAFRTDDLTASELKSLRSVFNELWKSHERLLIYDVEQNIEYSHEGKNYYIRIPWQLYLLALASRLDPKRLASSAGRGRLNNIQSAINANGFRYPYSGFSLSSRTNAIVYDTLNKTRHAKKKHTLYAAFDASRTFLSKPIISKITLLIFLACSVACIYYAFQLSSAPQNVGKDIGNGLLASIIFLILDSCISRLKKI